jgi:hypothetical protein
MLTNSVPTPSQQGQCDSAPVVTGYAVVQVAVQVAAKQQGWLLQSTPAARRMACRPTKPDS